MWLLFRQPWGLTKGHTGSLWGVTDMTPLSDLQTNSNGASNININVNSCNIPTNKICREKLFLTRRSPITGKDSD